MAKLFEGWTFSLPLPEPAKTVAEAEGGKSTTREDRCSVHNDKKRAKKATLHGPTLRALDCLEEILKQDKGACGLQAGDRQVVLYYLAEYDDQTERYALIYNPANGSIKGMDRTGNAAAQDFFVEAGKGSGKLILLMLAYASMEKDGPCYDEEFVRYYKVYHERKNAGDNAFIQAAYICCDNLYRRIMEKKIPCSRCLVEEGKVEPLEPESVINGFYAVDNVKGGEFCIFSKSIPKRDKKRHSVLAAEQIYKQNLVLTEEEKRRIPEIPDDYIVSEHAEDILKKVTKTGMRIFMLRGEAGGGKTTDVKIVAKCLGYPYYSLCCGEGTEETDLVSAYVPNTGKQEAEKRFHVSWDDFIMDPAGMLYDLTGVYEDEMSVEDAFARLLSEVFQKGEKEAEAKKDFLLVESELVQGCRRPSVVEIQEPASIGRAGTLIKLNSLLDDCATITLADGEVVRRHPDTVIILTTNAGYKGCRPMDQSVLSRMHKILDTEPMTVQDMVNRVMVKTGCKKEKELTQMAEQMKMLQEQYSDVIAMGGVCGYREYEDWVTGWMESGDLLKEAKGSVISKMTEQRQIQDEIFESMQVIDKITAKAA